jgi:hypothetical protein
MGARSDAGDYSAQSRRKEGCMNTLATLSAAQIERRAFLEARMAANAKSFIQYGEDLIEMRDQRLYRTTHATFEEYCREVWGMSKSHCNRLISSAEVAQSLAPIGVKLTTESQARELVRVEPTKRQEVIERAQADTGGKITAAAIKEAAQTIEMTPAPTTRRTVVFSEAKELWLIAKGRLDNIRKNDPARRDVLAAVAEYANARLSRDE